MYVGRFFYTTWDLTHHVHHMSSESGFTTAYLARECLGAGGNGSERNYGLCAGPFPFTTGSLQILSLDLAMELNRAPSVRRRVAMAVRDLQNKSIAAARKEVAHGEPPVFEDVFLGYAIYSLLPWRAQPIMLAMLEPYYYTYDDWGYAVRNSSFLLHWKLRSKPADNGGASEALLRRMRMTDDLVSAYHCNSKPALACERVNESAGALRVATDAAHWKSPHTHWASKTRLPVSSTRSDANDTEKGVGARRQRYLACLIHPTRFHCDRLQQMNHSKGVTQTITSMIQP